MRKTILALLAVALIAPAAAQVPTTIPANSVVGRLGIGSGPPQAIPFATLGAQLNSTAAVVGAGDVTLSGTVGAVTSVLTNIPNDTTLALDLLATNANAPSTPAAGKTRLYVDSTSKNFSAKNDAGTISVLVQVTTCTPPAMVIAISAAGATTCANLPAASVTNAMLANVAAWSFKCNNTSGSAAPQDCLVASLTNKASPASTDLIPIWDAQAGTLAQATVSSIAAGATVASVNTATGAVTLLVMPQGRLTLVTATPVMFSNQTAKGTIFYDNFVGNQVPYYTGTADAIDTIAAGEVSDVMVSAASAGQVTTAGVFDVWWVHSGANRICIAMSGAAGGGGGWASDTAGSNTARGTGYSQLDMTSRPYITNKNSITNCFNAATNYGPVAANRGTYLGSIYSTAAGQTGMAFTAAAGLGGANVLGVYNAYNRVPVFARSIDTTTSWAYGSSTWRLANGNPNNSISWVDGLQQSMVDGQYNVVAANSGSSTGPVVGCIADWSSGGPTVNALFYNSATTFSTLTANCPTLPLSGIHVINAIEMTDNGGTSTFYGSGFGSTTTNGQQLTIRLQM